MNRPKPVFIDLADSDEDDNLRNARNQNYSNTNNNRHSGNRSDGPKRSYTKNKDDSDSDFCEIDEGRSAPRLNQNSGPRTFAIPGPAGSTVFFSRQPQMGRPSDHPATTASAIHTQPQSNPLGKLERLDYQRSSVQSSTRAKSNVKSLSPRRSAQASPAATAQLSVPVSKLQIAQKDYSHRQVISRESRRCTNCIRDGRCCDGEAPCAFCFDPGFACLYPGEEPVSPSRKTIIPTNETYQDSQMTSGNERITEYNREQSMPPRTGYQTAQSSSSKASARHSSKASEDAKANNPRMSVQPAANKILETAVPNFGSASIRNSNLSVERNAFEDTHMNLDEQNDGEHKTADDSSVDSTRAEEIDVMELESIPATSWIPNSFEDVRKLIRTHEANIISHREYVVEAQLANAKLTSKRNIHVSTEKRGANPFLKMVAAQSRPPISEPPSTTLNMRVKARRSDYTNLKVSVNILGEDKAAHIPEYKSIGRLRSTFLARNVHGLKFVPYNSGIEEKDLDQRRKDLETRFKDHSSEEFRRQRECLESVYQWSEDFDEILRELRISQRSLWKWLLQSNLTSCQKCETNCAEPPDSALRGAEPSKAEKQRCQWLYEAMMKITQIGVWHFLTPKPGQIEKNPSDVPDEDGMLPKIESLLCSLCFTHNCLTHGSFIDEEIVVGEAVINDPEQQNNERQKAVLKFVEPLHSVHMCGLYCIPNWKASDGRDIRARDVIGLNDDGQLVGLRNKNVSMLTDLGPFRGNEPCTENCSLKRQSRADLNLTTTDVVGGLPSVYLTVDAEQKKLMLSLSRIYSSHLRLPCMVGKMLDIDCCRAFALLLRHLNEMHLMIKIDQTPNITESMEARKTSAKSAGYNTARSSVLEHRMTWVPCSHKGPCLSTHSDCACAEDHVHCEKACGCADNCRRRFKGCRCKKMCFLDDRCECYAANRECDPMLCHDCGVEEVLDPSNKYRDEVRNGRCRNNRLQLDLPPRTVKGMSEVQGWGLFLGEDLPANSFIGEYKGENISASESDRRGAIYAYVSQEYLFNLNTDNQLDGSRFGNKTRFINNSKAKEFINVFPKVMFVNGVTRIGLFTNRAIKAGEELLYDYGYPADLVKGEFWEKHERAIEHNGVVTPIAKPKFRPRMAKNAVDTPGQDEEDDDSYGDSEPLPRPKNGGSPLKGKRKRRMEEILVDSEEDDHKPTQQASAQEATDSSDYEEDEEDEEASTEEGATSRESGVEEVDESEDELSIPTRRVNPTRVDRRRGGEAQRRAARTRKLNKMRGK